MKKILLVLILSFVFSHSAFAQKMTMNEAIIFGLLNNPEIKASQLKLKLSDADIKEAGLLSNPKIMIDAAIADNSYKTGIVQTVELGGKRKKRLNVAKADKEVVAQEIASDIINLRSDIRIAYIELYTARERLKTSREIEKLTEQLIDIAKKREQAGQISRLEVLRAEIAYIVAKNDIQKELLSETKAFNMFNNKLAFSVDNDIELQSPAAEEDFRYILKVALEDFVSYAEKNNPELKRLEKSIEKTYSLEKLARASVIPDLSVAVGPNILVTKEGQTKTNVNVFSVVEMDLPVFNHGQAGIMRAKTQRNLLEKQLEAEKNKIYLAIKNAYVEFSQNEKLIETYEKELLPLAKAVLTKSELSFKEGKSDILTPLTSQQAYIELIKSYTDTLENYYKALSNLEKAIGVKDENL